MAKKAGRTLRDLRIAARDGDVAAVRALLQAYGKTELAEEVRRGKPLSPRCQRMVRCLVAGTGTHDTLGPWEFMDENGAIVNDAQNGPPPPGSGSAPAVIFEDED
jgi:hypothetical protein